MNFTGKPLCTAVQCQDRSPAKPFQMAFGAVYIQRRLDVTDRETMNLITESLCLQFFIGQFFIELQGCQALAPFDPSMMVHFCRRIVPGLIKALEHATNPGFIPIAIGAAEEKPATSTYRVLHLPVSLVLSIRGGTTWLMRIGSAMVSRGRLARWCCPAGH